MTFKEHLFNILSSCHNKIRDELENQVSVHVAMRDYSDIKAYLSPDILDCVDTSIIDKINALVDETKKHGIKTEQTVDDDGVYGGQTS